MFSANIFSAEANEAYYGQEFASERHRHGQEVNAKVNIRAVSNLVPIRKLGTALDIGSGYGYFVRKLCDAGLKAEGLEPSTQEAGFARAQGVHTTHAMLNDSTALGLFDLVTSFEVIEHSPQPREFLANAARQVGPNGWLVVMTDNFGARVVTEMGTLFPKWIPHSHVSHFSGETFLAECEALPGFQIQRTLSFTPWELWALAVKNKVRRLPSYSLDETLATEMKGQLRLPRIRKWINPLWFSLTARANLKGQLIYVAMKKVAK
jgi:SAM-dependent methyltransferase